MANNPLSPDLSATAAALRAIESARETGALGEAMRSLAGSSSLAGRAIEDAMRQQTELERALGDAAAHQTVLELETLATEILTREALEAAERHKTLLEAAYGGRGTYEAVMRTQSMLPTIDYSAAVRNPANAPQQSVSRRTELTSPADLGRLIRERRLAQGLTQQDLADAAGTGRRFVSELEAGKATLELGKVLIVCAALGLDIFAAPR
ncbi:helix-turn-helix transcriptional regulator [Brevundimonas aveniformis]|uniref:helix-turn-helix transcriptional regulator n=1 Tax=Brevundimonas aveniformis TaxID=370977 RepID=UPI00249291F9|nr:helix-turn-helix transcriptional regulator [Brevundimonas aveniformis]